MLWAGSHTRLHSSGTGQLGGTGPALSPKPGTGYPCSCVTCCIKLAWAGMLPAVGTIKVGAACPAHIHSGERMAVALPGLALALLCLLRAGAQVPVQPDLDTGKFAGMWHVTAIASNCSIFLKMKDGMKSSMAIISFMPEGDLAMKLVWPLLDKCHKFELLFQQSGQAGHYVGAQEKRDLHVMDTDYSHYAVLHEAQHSETEPSTALQLLSALGAGTWLTGRDGGTGSRQGLGSPPLSRATNSSTPCPSPRELILG
ncbi:LOW QUALITY PROTEIN: extracellular fatty acid-binding protein-like [Corvus moneduloides]|uniref:LOW QUALITY PROTEIN: extracellular fatty acid-binding protein-like n=1 Tax=Corvus moneduloides TaxID=1196302 RepID=UPI001363D869|nr:LOW QUALITY PROTEIN: extracellular fatty acid-binding protein-like [Corvus moneduloides]